MLVIGTQRYYSKDGIAEWQYGSATLYFKITNQGTAN